MQKINIFKLCLVTNLDETKSLQSFCCNIPHLNGVKMFFITKVKMFLNCSYISFIYCKKLH